MTNVTVITNEALDLGTGETDDHFTFVDARYHVDKDTETLHIQSDRGEGSGNIASFTRGAWAAVVKGDIVSLTITGSGDRS